MVTEDLGAYFWPHSERCDYKGRYYQFSTWLIVCILTLYLARAWGAEDEIAVSDLSGWPLIPVNDGQDLVFVAYIHLVVNPSHTLAVSMDGLSNWTVRVSL